MYLNWIVFFLLGRGTRTLHWATGGRGAGSLTESEHDESLLYRDRDSKCIEGSLRLSDSPDLIAAGQVRNCTATCTYIVHSDSPETMAELAGTQGPQWVTRNYG